MNVHNLKTHPAAFEAVVQGMKRYEYRRDDRKFEVGDQLILEEWDPATESYTKRSVTTLITYLTRGGNYGVPEGYVVLSISPPRDSFGAAGLERPEPGTSGADRMRSFVEQISKIFGGRVVPIEGGAAVALEGSSDLVDNLKQFLSSRGIATQEPEDFTKAKAELREWDDKLRTWFGHVLIDSVEHPPTPEEIQNCRFCHGEGKAHFCLNTGCDGEENLESCSHPRGNLLEEFDRLSGQFVEWRDVVVKKFGGSPPSPTM